MAFKKRKKVSRHRGSHTHGRGAKKKARGKGHRGGIGLAGSGKRADQKKSKVLNLSKKYFGKSKTLRAPERVKLKAITLDLIQSNIENFVKKGAAKESSGKYVLELKNTKIIGDADLNIKLDVKVAAISKNASERIKSAGGSVELINKKKNEEKKESVKKENSSEKSEKSSK